MPRKETKKTVKKNEESNEQNETKEVTRRAVSTGNDWKEDVYEDEENVDHDAVSDPELEDQGNQDQPKSIFDKMDLPAIEKLDKERLTDLSNQQLLQVLYVRGMTQQNPTVYHAARKALQELSLQPIRMHNSRRPPRQRVNFGRGSHRGSSNSRGGYNNKSFRSNLD